MAVVLSVIAVVASFAIPGPTGATGAAGADGAKGDTGLQGLPGPGTLMAQNGTIAIVAIAATCTHYTGINVTTTGAGTVVVTAQVRVQISHVAGTADIVRTYVGVNATDCTYDAWRSYTSVVSAAPTDAGYYLTLTVQKPLTVAAAGTYKFYVNGDMYSGAASTDYFTGAGTAAVFYPA